MSSNALAGAQTAANDEDTLETQEWLEALAAVLDREGPERAHYLLERLVDEARRSGAHIPYLAQHRLRQHDPDLRAGAGTPGQPGAGVAHPRLCALERHGHGGAGQQAFTRRTAATWAAISPPSLRWPP